tara:strand:+ start:41 stop:1243 length:1203 start_codon:yes stop_codon:yes gene_type:complete
MRGTDWTPEKLREFSDHIADVHDQGYLPFTVHLCGGNEEQLIDIFSNINEGDYVLSTHRNSYHALLHGIPPDEVEEKMRNGRSMFIFDRERNFYVSAIIGGTAAIAVGMGWALKRKNSDKRVWCFIGDGTEDTGHFAEAVRYVDGWDLPVTFVIEDDGMAVNASKKSRWGKDEDIEWPSCVVRYHYTKTRPHIRTGNFAPLKVMKSVMKTDEEYFPYLDEKPVELNIEKTDLSFKDSVTKAMTEMGEDGNIFLGYSIIPGDAMETLKNVNISQKIETPVAENLMVGLAIGMSFEGFRPVVYFERHDFMLVAADAIANHLDKIERISHGEFKCPVILKTVVDDSKLFYSGPTHEQNFTKVFRELLKMPVLDPKTPDEVLAAYRYAQKSDRPTMIVEHKNLF